MIRRRSADQFSPRNVSNLTRLASRIEVSSDSRIACSVTSNFMVECWALWACLMRAIRSSTRLV